jgi:hypothetical protein
MELEIFNFKVKLHNALVGTFSVKLIFEDCDIIIHNVSLYEWSRSERAVYLPSNFKKEPVVESSEISKFILEEITRNYLKSFLYFKNSIYNEESMYIIDINLDYMLKNLNLDLFKYENELNEVLKDFKSECSITNYEIHVTYRNENCKFDILNTIFQFIEEKNPNLRNKLDMGGI